MSTLYPGAIDDSTTLPPPGPNTVTNAGTVTHAILHDNEILALQALETKLGTGSATSTTSTVLRASSNGTSTWGKVVLTTDVTGTLPVANGGTGITSLGTGVATFLGTPTSANLVAAVTDETGSGALVFGTSPAITTPTGIVKGDVGLGNVDNTSDATKNAAAATLTNHILSGSNNTISNIPTNALVLSGALTTNVTTTESTASTSYTDLATSGPTVTTTIGASGMALVTVTSHSFNTGTNDTFHAFAVSGNTTVAANDLNSKRSSSTSGFTFSGTFLVTGLTAGSNTFTSKYRVSGGTGSWLNRIISVIPL